MWNIIKITLIFIVVFLPSWSAQVEIIQHSRYQNFGDGSWKERTSYWYDINIIRTRGEEILQPHTFQVINVKKTSNVAYPYFNFTSDIETPNGVELSITGNNVNLQGDMSISWIQFYGSNLLGGLDSPLDGAANIDIMTLLKIPSSVPDMVNEPIRWMNPHQGNSNVGYFNLQTLPDIEVPDFDFGRVIMNNSETSLVLYESDKVFITGGTPNTSVKVFVTQPQVDLVCANTEDTLRVDFAFYSPIIRLDSTGYASSILEASLRTDQVVDSGVYTGTVEVQVEYN